MNHGGRAGDLHAQEEVLVVAVGVHNAIIQDAEQQAIAHPDDDNWPDVIATHREIVNDHVADLRVIRADLRTLPRQRRAAEG